MPSAARAAFAPFSIFPEALLIHPIFDPESLPAEPADAGLLPVCAQRLTPDGLRARFAQRLPWQPEPQEWLGAWVRAGSSLGEDARANLEAGSHTDLRADLHVLRTDLRTDARTDLREFREFRGLREAAVLMPFVVRASGLTVLLTRRTDHLSHHAGQISFPGGRREPDDPDAVAAALREAREEVGLDPARVEVLGVLPDYLTSTGFRVTPVAGLVHEPLTLSANAREVAEIFEVPLAFLMDPAHHEVRVFRREGGERRFFAMPYPNKAAAFSALSGLSDSASGDGAMRARYFIWGATAGMLRNFYRFLRA